MFNKELRCHQRQYISSTLVLFVFFQIVQFQDKNSSMDGIKYEQSIFELYCTDSQLKDQLFER